MHLNKIEFQNYNINSKNSSLRVHFQNAASEEQFQKHASLIISQ